MHLSQTGILEGVTRLDLATPFFFVSCFNTETTAYMCLYQDLQPRGCRPSSYPLQEKKKRRIHNHLETIQILYYAEKNINSCVY